MGGVGTLLAAAPVQAAQPSEVRFAVEMGDFWFSPAYIAVDVNATVNITLVNTAGQPHEYEIIGYGVEGVADAYGNGSLVFVANKTGTFTIVCGIPGHSTQGMIGRLIVVGPGFELNPLPQVAGQMIAVLEAVEAEYAAANVTGGVPQNAAEYNESRDFLEAAKDLWATIAAEAALRDDSGAAKVDAYLENLTAKIAARAPYADIGALVDALKEELTEIGAAPAPGQAGTWQDHVSALRAGLVQVAGEYKAGDAARADTLLGEVYLDHVEPLEKALAEVDPALKTKLETQVIVELRGLIRGGASPAEVDAKVAQINATLLQVEAALAPPAADAGPWLLLGFVGGLTAGAVLGVVGFALYLRRLTARRDSGQARPAASDTKGGNA